MLKTVVVWGSFLPCVYSIQRNVPWKILQEANCTLSGGTHPWRLEHCAFPNEGFQAKDALLGIDDRPLTDSTW